MPNLILQSITFPNPDPGQVELEMINTLKLVASDALADYAKKAQPKPSSYIDHTILYYAKKAHPKPSSYIDHTIL